jgi:hypothetical protein
MSQNGRSRADAQTTNDSRVAGGRVEEPVLPLSEAAERYGVRISRLRQQVAKRVLPGARKERIGGRDQWVVPSSTLLALGLTELDQAGDEDISVLPARNERLLERGVIHLAEVIVHQRDEIISAIGDWQVLQGRTEEALVRAAGFEADLRAERRRLAAAFRRIRTLKEENLKLKQEIRRLRPFEPALESAREEVARLQSDVETHQLRSRSFEEANRQLEAELQALLQKRRFRRR